MQQTLEQKTWVASARVGGVLRYHYLTLGKIVLWVLAILMGSQILSLLVPLLGVGEYWFGGVSSDFSAVMLATLICSGIVAKKSTRFLLRFGTSRLSVWIGNLIALIVSAAVLLLGTIVVNLASSGITLLLSQAMPERYALVSYYSGVPQGGALVGYTLNRTLQELPQQFLWITEWACLFYLLGCCLRRNKGLTLSVVIGIPLVMMILMLVPAVQRTVAAVSEASQGEVVLMGMQVVQWLSKVSRFMVEQWPMIQLVAALVSLPLSYWCMRNTPQP